LSNYQTENYFFFNQKLDDMKSLSVLFFILLLGFCTKAQSPKQDNSINTFEKKLVKTSLKSKSTELDMVWLKEFQNHLLKAIAGKPTFSGTKFTDEQAATGVEALLNIFYGVGKNARTAEITTEMLVSASATGDWLDLYKQSVSAVELLLKKNNDSDRSLDFISIEVLNQEAGRVNLKVKASFGNKGTCSIKHYLIPNSVDCLDNPAFDSSEAYYLGIDGLTGDPWLPDCLNECGGVAPCGTVTSYAMEETEAHVNANIPEPDICPSGYVWDGTYSDVLTISVEGDASWDEQTQGGCFDELNMTPCECLNAEVLNCFYCSLMDEINGDVDPYYFIIPDGFVLMSVNLGVDYCVCDSPPEEYLTRLSYEYTYGKPNCVQEGQIEDPKTPIYLEPVHIELSYYSIR